MKLPEMDKKVLFVIHPHSIVDVITNSSTELFVGTTDKTIEVVEEILQDLLNVHNKITDSNRSLGSVLTVTVIDKDNVNQWASEILEWIKPYYIESKYPDKPDWDDFRNEDGRTDWKAFDKAIKEWQANLPEELINAFIGNIVIQGAQDNSIPYEMFESIERIFNNYERIHQG